MRTNLWVLLSFVKCAWGGSRFQISFFIVWLNAYLVLWIHISVDLFWWYFIIYWLIYFWVSITSSWIIYIIIKISTICFSSWIVFMVIALATTTFKIMHRILHTNRDNVYNYFFWHHSTLLWCELILKLTIHVEL